MAPSFPKRSARAVSCRIYELGLKSGNPRTKHSKDEAFWEVPNPLNSYYAGVLAADGTIATAREVVQWTCEQTDRPAMEGLVRASRFTGAITDTPRKSPCSENVSIHSRISFSACQKWNADLARNFNVIPRKAHRLAPPAFSSDLLACCYLIGYIDGDGCIHAAKSGDPSISFTSASRAIIQWIQTFVESRFPFQVLANPKPNHIRSSSEDTYHHYVVRGMVAAKLFLFLRQLPVPKFPRKWDNPAFLAIVERYREWWPEFFTPDMEVAFDENGNLPRRNEIQTITPIAA